MKYITLLLLCACNEPAKAPPQPPPPSARTEACTAALQTFDKFVETGDPDTPPEQRAKVKASVVERCVADQWSDEALACMRAAGTSHDTFKCWNDRLTKAQRDAVSAAFAKLSP